MGCRRNRLSEQWAVGIMGCRNNDLTPFKQVNVLRKLKCTLSKQTLSNIYLTFIRPTLEYACEVWDGCFEREVAELEKYN